METERAQTFTQRRDGKSKTPNLSKQKLSSKTTEEEKSNSPLKAVVWFLFIVLFAFVAYWAFKTYITSEDVAEVRVTPTPVVADDSIVALNTLPDDPIADFDDESYWNTQSKQITTSEPDALYTIESIVVQPYESYLGFSFEIAGGDETSFPQTTAEISSDLINLTFKQISENNSLFSTNQRLTIDSEVVSAIERVSGEVDTENFKLSLSSKQPFALYSKVENGRRYVVLDILFPVVPTPTETESISGTPVPTSAQGESSKSVTGNASGNNVRITGYNYFDSPERFTYNVKLSDAFPNATATLEGDTLTLVVNEVGFDGIVGNGGDGSTDLAATGVKNVSLVEISNQNNVSTFVFSLVNPKGFNLSINEEESFLVLEIDN